MSESDELRINGPRSFLFVPADRANELLAKAAASRADALVVDLEDGVLSDRRAVARSGLAAVVAATVVDRPLFVRTAAAGSESFAMDLEVAASLAASGIVLPKCESAIQVAHAVDAWSAVCTAEPAVVALLETARGILAAPEIADRPGVVGVAIGAEDLAADVGFRRTGSGREILLARSQVVLAAAAARRWAIDTPCLDFRRPDVVRQDARVAKELGFTGKLAIHPAQVEPIHEGFRPSRAEVEAARRTLAAWTDMEAAGHGVGALAGRMLDRPLVEIARRVMLRAARYEEDGTPDG